MYNFQILTEVDSEKWNKDLMKSEYANFFQTVEYLTPEYDEGRFPLFIYVFDENGNAVGQLGLMIIKSVVIHASPLFRRFTNIISKLASRVDWVCGPIIHASDKESRTEILLNIIKAVEVIAEKNNVVFISGKSPPYDLMIDEDYKNELKKHDYMILDLITFITNLNKSIQDLWNNVTENAKRDINRAKKRNIVVKEIEDYESLKEYFPLSQKWNEARGKEIVPTFQGIERLWNLQKTGIEKIFLAYQDGELISGLRVGCFNGIALAELGISSYSKPTSLGGPLLTWHTLEWAKNNGMRIYDFTGGYVESPNNKKDVTYKHQQKGLIFYKKKWGGDDFYFYHFIKVRKKFTYKLYTMLLDLLLSYTGAKKKQYKQTSYKEDHS